MWEEYRLTAAELLEMQREVETKEQLQAEAWAAVTRAEVALSDAQDEYRNAEMDAKSSRKELNRIQEAIRKEAQDNR